MSKAFLIDYNKCNGCYSCQIACKDEFCDQAWLPYSEAQPELRAVLVQSQGHRARTRSLGESQLSGHSLQPL